ncbi:hypothetical protein [Brevundimonas sp.]|uniref:DUF4376 domain-containing protein n=1 Tax=Brevundimonas sp. TaxID=1871086 RepID=UPI0035AF129D
MAVFDCSTGTIRDHLPGEVPAHVPSLDELRVARNAEVTAKREAVFQAGYTPATGGLAGHTLQVRNIEDRANWLTSQASYSAAVAAGLGSQPGAVFRTATNETIILTYAEGLAVIVQGMAAWGQSIMARSWALKDEIDAAGDAATLALIDIDEGWPTG